jgi:CheY-like chemotaxis protein
MKAQEASSLRILIIEDNKDLATVICALLELMGHNAVSANTGSAGLAIAIEDKPDVIFCDIGLPDMNGYEVAKQIKSEEHLKDVFLVALTGYAGNIDKELAIDAGFNRHISKPVSFSTLTSVLEQCMAVK